jgi:Domain of unknown function (DUF4157)
MIITRQQLKATPAPAVMPMPSGFLQRQSAYTTVASEPVNPVSGAAEAVRGQGTSLPGLVEHEAAQRYGFSFADVRIHTSEQASSAATSLRASAFTLGKDIAFGANRYAPNTPQGQMLLQHELRHVAQQRSAVRTPSPELDSPQSTHEHEARQILNPHVEPLTTQRIQCAPENAQFSLGTGLVNTVGQAAFGQNSWPFIKAVLEGFVGGLQGDVKAGRADAAKSNLAKLLVPWNAGKFYLGYILGLIIGLVSPITDLVKGVIGLVSLGISALEWLAKWSPAGVAISPERQKKISILMQKFNSLTLELGKSLIDFVSDPKGTIQKFSGFLDNLMQMALGKARELGAKGAHAVFDFLEMEDYFEMGKGIGEVIGALIAQVLLLVFSEAIGNLISKGASFLGKAAEFVAGKAVEAFNWVKGIFSEVIGLLRNAVKGALKLFEGLVNNAIEAFDALIGLFSESASLETAGEKVAAGVGRGVSGPLPNTMESRMVTSVRTSPAKVADLTPPKVHPSNVPKRTPVLEGEFDEPLTKVEKKLTPDQLRQKQILDEFEERQSAAYKAAEQETKGGPGKQQTGKAGAGMKAKPKHHVLPQEQRPWFEQRGFKGKLGIDEFTVELEEAEHQAIHGGGDYRLGRTTGFEWNRRLMVDLNAEEVKLGGRLLTRKEILTVVKRLMDEYKIPAKFVSYK